MLFYTYILKSQKDNTYYYGSTNNIEGRIKIHNLGKERYTKGHIPYVLHYFEEYKSRSEAYARERFFKSINGYIWLKNQKII